MTKYDPHYFPDAPTGPFDTIYCGYVLNVMTKADGRRVMKDIQDLLRSKRSSAFIVVRRDVKKAGVTSKGTYQRNVKLEGAGARLVIENCNYALYQVYKNDKVEVW